jgi:YVTN family beta-propeller protein
MPAGDVQRPGLILDFRNRHDTVSHCARRRVWKAPQRHLRRGEWLAVGILAIGAIGLIATYALLGVPIARLDGGAPNLAYVAGGGANGHDLVILDVAKRAVAGRVDLGAVGSSVALSIDSHYVYVTLPSTGMVAVIDATRQVVAASIPVGAEPRAAIRGYSRGTVVLFVTVSGKNAVALVNPDTRHILATIAVGANPSGEALASQGTGIVDTDINDAELYVANTGADTISVISADQQKVIATIPVPGHPLQVVVPATGGIAYVATTTGAIYALSLARHFMLGMLVQLPSHSAPGQMDYDAITGQIYVPDTAAGIVEVLAPATDSDAPQATHFPPEPARSVALSGGPNAVAITFDGAYGFVAERNSGRVAMLDVASRQALATISVGGAPDAVLTGAYPPPAPAQPPHTTIYVGSALVILLLIALGGYVVWVRRGGRPRDIIKIIKEKHS